MQPSFGKKEFENVKKVLQSNFVTEGDVTSQFEKNVAKYVGAKHAIATTSGTSALELALRSLKIGKRDEVILPSFTHPATGSSILSTGAKPRFVDIKLDTLNIDNEKIEKKINSKTKAILFVSQFGNPVDIKPILNLQQKYGLSLIEDAACSLGSKIGSKKIGTFADITCFSFHPRKIITTGQGGMLVTNDIKLAQNAKTIKNFGLVNLKNQLIQKFWGTNLKFTDIQAAIGIAQLSKIEAIIKSRIKKANYYSKLFEELSKHILIPSLQKNSRHIFQTYCIVIQKPRLRDKLMSYLTKQKIETRIGSYALHMQPIFSTSKSTSLENSKIAYMNGLAIPLHGKLVNNYQIHVVESIKKFLNIHNYN